MVGHNLFFGNRGEDIATNFLKKKGYIILERNYRALGTEIDIIARDKDELVFVEVKSRNSRKYGDAYESVTEFKMQNIIQTATAYIMEKNLFDIMVRFDIIEIYFKEKEINHIESAFMLS